MTKPTKPAGAEVPAAFSDRPGGLLNSPAAVEAVTILDRLGIDHSGHDKVIRELAPVAWAEWLRGGGATMDRERLGNLQHERSRAIGRKGGLMRQGMPTQEVEGELAALERDIARYQALVDAAGDACLDDQLARRAKADESARKLADLQAQLAPLRAARVRSAEVEAMERAELEAERAAHGDAARFAAGAAEFERRGAQAGKLRQKAHAALAASCETACARLGSEAAGLVLPDLEFLQRNPHRAPAAVEDLHRRAAVLFDLIERLGDHAGRGPRSFWAGAGEATGVIAGRCGLASPIPTERTALRTFAGATF
ncbi:MAG TPA: hypothetical protein VGK94_08370 [Candidatus Polarisedimenticolia bacterium]|jgi:hypothetical protein